MIQGRVLRSCGKPRSTPLKQLDLMIRLFEGNSFHYLSDVAQESRISRRLAWPRTVGRIYGIPETVPVHRDVTIRNPSLTV